MSRSFYCDAMLSYLKVYGSKRTAVYAKEFFEENDGDFHRAFLCAIKGGFPKVSKIFLELMMQNYMEFRRYVLNDSLIYACGTADAWSVKYYIDQGADIHAYDDASLYAAVSNNRRNVIFYLLKNGVNVPTNGLVPLDILNALRKN